VIADADLKEIKPKPPAAHASSEHIQSGIPLPKAARVRTFSPADWEEFIEEWATSLGSFYSKVRRFGGLVTSAGFQGVWDNYQCKHYGHPLRPSDVWVEIGKIIYYAQLNEYVPPRRHYFVCSQGIGTSLEKLLNDSEKLKLQARANWDKHCLTGITDTCQVPLDGGLLAFFDAFDFRRFSSKSLVELIDGHAATGYHTVRFGGGLPLRPAAGAPPADPTPDESRYIRQLLDAYGDHLGAPLATPADLKFNPVFSKDFLRQRERFYHAESLRNFARDTVPEGTFYALQDEVYHGVVDVCEGTYANGFERMKATVAQAVQVALTSNALSPATKAQDRQGICHQLANDDRLAWVPDDD
jgi:hypothetical protein